MTARIYTQSAVRRTARSIVLLAATLGATWLGLTSLSPGSAVASWAPCPRNWGWAPAWLPRTSPLEAVAMRFTEGPTRGHAKLCYGRPSLRGRTMLGGEAVPFGQLWRTGANEPTTLHVDLPVRIGPLALPPGSYSLYSIPEQALWQIVVNGSTRQWGLESEYDDAVVEHEIGRFTVAAEMTDAPVETLTIRAMGAGGSGYDLVIEWQRTRVRIPITAGFGDA